MGKFIITVLGLLVSIRGIKIYSRTGLRGELLIGVAGFVFVVAYQAGDIALGIIGYIIINIGMLILFRSEKKKWKVIFGPLPFHDRLLANVPQVITGKESQTTYKVTGVISGILCFLMAFEFYRLLKTNNIPWLLDKNITGLVLIAIFVLAGVLLVGYYLFKKVE